MSIVSGTRMQRIDTDEKLVVAIVKSCSHVWYVSPPTSVASKHTCMDMARLTAWCGTNLRVACLEDSYTNHSAQSYTRNFTAIGPATAYYVLGIVCVWIELNPEFQACGLPSLLVTTTHCVVCSSLISAANTRLPGIIGNSDKAAYLLSYR